MALDERSYQIVLQNLLNRATDIEIADAAVEKRKVVLGNIETNLGEIGKIFMKKINAFGKPKDVEPSTPSKNTIKVI